MELFKINQRYYFLLFHLCLIFILFCLADHRVVFKRVCPTGDEPHYLVIAHSIAYDGDIQVSNNYRQEDWRAFFKENKLSPHYAVNSYKYSVHNFGLPLIIALPYRIGGYPLVLGIMSAFMVISLYFCWLTAEGIIGRKLNNYLALWFIGLSTPFFTFASQIYPEVAATLIVSISLYILLVKNKPWNFLIILVGMSILPLLHIKFLVLAGLIGIITLIQYRSWLLRLITIGWIGFIAGEIALENLICFGTFSLTGSYQGLNFDPYKDFIRTFQTYLLDPQYGLLFHAPIYLLSIFGFYAILRRVKLADSHLPFLLVLPFAGYYLFLSNQPLFLIGWATACRFIVPIMPILAILLIIAMNIPLKKTGKTIYWLLGIAGLLMSWLLIRYPIARYTEIDFYLSKFIPGAATHIPHYWKFWSWSFSRTVPKMDPHAYLTTLIWMILGIVITRVLIITDKENAQLPNSWRWKDWFKNLIFLFR